MIEPIQTVSEFDLQPDPRILPMLGEINLEQWRCLAELVDNSIDSFVHALDRGQAIAEPEVHIAIPTSGAPGAKITVRDNGPGMDGATLEKAVRAGWTSNDPLHSLGMFGMGFNIATARLGSHTRVWTTRQGDPEWVGLEIDFDRLMRQRHFRTPRLTRPKTDPHEHGTEISIERLKPDQAAWFSRAGNRTKVAKHLGRAYSAMIRPNGVPLSLRLMLNGNQVQGRDHCIWGGEGNPDRDVQTSRYGMVRAYQPFDVRLSDRLFCARCWQWLPHGEEACPACGSSDEVVSRERRIHGWLGLQRYLSPTEFGIDLIRHGRKIELANRDLFLWNNGDRLETEYPIDDPRQRGRIVGEIHLDHCRVVYTKDRFDRNDHVWEEMVRIVRGDGPLRPDKAAELGFGQNTSPLFLLFQAFRRSSPKPKVAGCYAKLMIVPDNDRAEEMAKRFYAGEAEYQTDAKWWELVDEADRQLLGGSTPPPAGGDGGGIGGFGPGDDGPTPSTPPESPGSDEGESTPQAPPERYPLRSLSREYRDDLTNQRWDVQAFRVEAADPELGGGDRPWSLKATPSGIHRFLVNFDHGIFRSATMTPIDGLLAELAWSAMDFQRGGDPSITFGRVLASLRERYAVASKLDPATLSMEAASTLTDIARGLSKNLEVADSRTLFAELSPAEQDAIQQKMAIRSVPNPQQVIDSGRFLEFAPRRTLLRFFEGHPELFFDGKYWDAAYESLDYGRPAATEEARAQVVRYYASLLTDVAWLAEQEPTNSAEVSRARLLRASLAVELLAADSGVENGS